VDSDCATVLRLSVFPVSSRLSAHVFIIKACFIASASLLTVIKNLWIVLPSIRVCHIDVKNVPEKIFKNV